MPKRQLLSKRGLFLPLPFDCILPRLESRSVAGFLKSSSFGVWSFVCCWWGPRCPACQKSTTSQTTALKLEHCLYSRHDSLRHKQGTIHSTMATPSSHSRKPSATSRPTTPLRPPSRTSLRASQTTPSGPLSGTASDPLASLEPAFAELSDSMADLEANFMHLQLLNESLNRFNECFGGFLYGMNMSAFCVDFPEVCLPRN